MDHETRAALRRTWLLLLTVLAGAACGESPAQPTADPDDGIRLSHVEANQGVAVAIVRGGVQVPAAARNAPLIANRHTLVRATWQLGRAWRPRNVRATLELTAPSGEPAMTLLRNVYFGNGEQVLNWQLAPDQVVPGTHFRVVLAELDGTPVDGGPAAASRDELGFDGGGHVIRVTVVPVRHDYDGSCGDVPVLSATDVATLGELLHRRNPTERVIMTLREPYVWAESLATYTGLLGALSQLRFADDADPAEYYAGLVHHCVRTGGQAIDMPAFPTRDNGWTRTTVSAWRGAAPLTSTTFVHELGHAQGRRHVRCTGSEGGPDPDYPYSDGTIGVWGYNIELPDATMPWLSGRRYDPATTNDYMGYCTGAQHVSDYGWRLVHRHIAEISGWAAPSSDRAAARASAAAGAAAHGLLIGALDADGAAHWFTVPGTATDRTPTAGWALELMVDGTQVVVPAAVSIVTGVTNVVAVLPVPLDRVTGLMLVEGATRTAVPVAGIRRGAGPS